MNVVIREDLRALAIQWASVLADERCLNPVAIERFTKVLHDEAIARCPLPEPRLTKTEQALLRRSRARDAAQVPK